ncbi:hypothetical protein E5676_scaffold863G00860 [Cucumis melo var. makuwa]|uniref:Uncharacterized protein n=1 Tax=Cucumis melo var. makuwa TaxID=1194695 RepID=A0A5D3BW41_CUCMM|nr:hypothetical protein E5676_scaffold863G00860 [Cucumis melo var. makuwa]
MIGITLIALTRRNAKFDWSDNCKQSFQELKKRLVTTSILSLPVIGKDYVIYCDVSREVLGCGLMQDRKIKDYDCEIEYHPGKGNVVADALSKESRLPKSALCGIRVSLLSELRGSKAVVTAEDSESFLAQFLVSELKDAILKEAHSSTYIMHPSSTKMYITLKKTYWWPGMKQ